jgi:hypothetical protein
MRHIKRIFEDKNFRDVNHTILDECDFLQDLIDEFEERGDVRILITCGGFRAFSISEFKKYINQNIDNSIPSIQYALSGSFKDKTDILLSFIDSLKSRIKDTFCRIDGVNISDSHKYIQQFSRDQKRALKKNQKYEFPYLITETHDCSFSIQLTNTKGRYFEANPELFT